MIFYIGIIKKFLNIVSYDSHRAEELLNDIMNEKIYGIDQIRKKWFKKEKVD